MSPMRRWITNDVVFTAFALALVGLTYTSLVDRINEPLCAATYGGATWLLDALGVPFTADDATRSIARGPFAIEVSGRCSGLRGIALWTAVLTLLPLRRRWKAVHFLLGTAVLLVVNVVRTAHLFTLRAGMSPRFDLYHEWLWPMAIVGLVLSYRLVMLIVARRRPPEVARA